jgi:hypothetical protein
MSGMADGNEAGRRRAAQQQVAVDVLGRGGSYGDAGEEADVDRRTIGRWMQDAAFRRRVAARRDAWVAEISGQLVAAGPDAVTVLIQESRIGERSADRVRAATALLHQAARFRRDHDLEERLRALEEKLGLSDTGPEQPAEDPDLSDPSTGEEH